MRLTKFRLNYVLAYCITLQISIAFGKNQESESGSVAVPRGYLWTGTRMAHQANLMGSRPSSRRSPQFGPSFAFVGNGPSLPTTFAQKKKITANNSFYSLKTKQTTVFFFSTVFLPPNQPYKQPRKINTLKPVRVDRLLTLEQAAPSPESTSSLIVDVKSSTSRSCRTISLVKKPSQLEEPQEA